MSAGAVSTTCSPVDTILWALIVARNVTTTARPPQDGMELAAGHAETLRMVSAFAQIGNDAVREMLVQITEVIAETTDAGFDA